MLKKFQPPNKLNEVEYCPNECSMALRFQIHLMFKEEWVT